VVNLEVTVAVVDFDSLAASPPIRWDLMSAHQITLPNVKLELDDLLALIRRLDAEARQRIAEVLAEAEMDGRLGELIRQLAAKTSSAELSDAEIDREVAEARRARFGP
jgi:hypothetical protein